ncbi:MAG: RNA methyltransferase [Pseudomonadota bacterium]|nr:RNA methyltransferase [Pseudomonadota bacterium]
MQRITSAHNTRLREAARLIESSRDRRKSGKCVLEGEHLVTVYAERIGAPETLIVCEDALDRPGTKALVERLPEASLVVPVELFRHFASLPVGVGIVAVVTTPREAVRSGSDLCVLLDDLQDPGNMGSILRSAAAAGVDRVLLSKRCVFAWSPKVLRAGQGAHFMLSIEEEVDLATWCRDYAQSGGRVVGAVAREGRSLFDTPLTGRIAIAIGNEGGGLSPQVDAALTVRVTIPMPGGIESLNAAAAAAICLFECVRQRTGASSPSDSSRVQ